MCDDTTASRPRCLVVATGLTAAIWGVAAVLVRSAAQVSTHTSAPPATQPTTPDEALVWLCVAALVVAATWAWLQALAGVADAWRGATPRPGVVRRVAQVACGAALAGTLATPAHASADRPRPDLLAGLPLPERAEGRAHPPRPDAVTVRTGDTLWAIAEHDLGGDATDREITARWHDLYITNRAVVGPDPDLILPGQVLRLTKEKP